MADPEQGPPSPAARQTWPVRVFRLGDEPGDDLSDHTTPEARLEMMWPLALEAWSLTGRALPAYPRHETPLARRPLAVVADGA